MHPGPLASPPVAAAIVPRSDRKTEPVPKKQLPFTGNMDCQSHGSLLGRSLTNLQGVRVQISLIRKQPLADQSLTTERHSQRQPGTQPRPHAQKPKAVSKTQNPTSEKSQSQILKIFPNIFISNLLNYFQPFSTGMLTLHSSESGGAHAI